MAVHAHAIPPTCLVCQNSFEPAISLGRQPIANAFLDPKDVAREYFYDLEVGMCPNCRMVQLVHLVDERRLFHEAYPFFSGSSRSMARHFAQFAASIRALYLDDPDPLVIELGSNDGTMLRNFAEAGIRHLGIEPSENVARVARDAGIRTISRFFDETLAQELVADHGQADAILAANVTCHIPYLHSVAEGVRSLLKPDGVFVFEDPYLGDIVEKVSYDQIYDEHVFYFSLTSLQYLFAAHKLEVVDVQPQEVHGGEMRFTVRHRGAGTVSPRVGALAKRERELRLDSPRTLELLGSRIERSREELTLLLRRLASEGRRVVGYGATSKSTTVTNYCGITTELLEYISDTTPIKQGRLSPGAHIPVRPYSEFSAAPPEYALLFAWNHAGEIFEKETEFISRGGRFIVYVPQVGLKP